MKVLKNVPKFYIGSDVASIASVLNVGFLLLPIFLSIFLIQKLFEQDFDLSILLGVCLLFTLYLRNQFLNGLLRKSIVVAIVFFNVAITLTCTMGNGINDISIIGFPILIGFSGIVLDQKKLAIASLLSITGILWLVTGDYFHIYMPVSNLEGSAGDFLGSSLLIILGGVVAFSLTSNMRNTLKEARREIIVSKKEADNLEMETNEKLEIIEEIHRTVINSLNHIQQLIDQREGNVAKLKPLYEGMKRKVTVIEVAHNILLSAQAPIMLDLRELTSKLLNEYEKKLSTPVLLFDLGNTPHNVPLDLAINYGICLIELIHEADHEAAEKLNIQLLIDNEHISLIISGFKRENNSGNGIVIDLLIKQLNGVLSKTSTEFKLSFQHIERL